MVTPIAGAFLDNVGLSMVGAAMRQTSVGVGAFDGFAANVAALPTAADNKGKIYLVGENATPHTSNGSAWTPGKILVVWEGAKFYLLSGKNITAEGVFTTKPTYDNMENPTSASGGVCRILTIGAATTTPPQAERALTKAEVKAALEAAGF